MKELNNRLKRLNQALPDLILGILIYGVLVEIVGIWFSQDKIRYTTGLLIGLACAIYMAVNLAMVIEEAVRLGEGHTKWLSAKSVFRYGIVCIVFFLMCYFKLGQLIPAFLGVLGLKASAYAQPLLYKLLKRENIEKGGEEAELQQSNK